MSITITGESLEDIRHQLDALSPAPSVPTAEVVGSPPAGAPSPSTSPESPSAESSAPAASTGSEPSPTPTEPGQELPPWTPPPGP